MWKEFYTRTRAIRDKGPCDGDLMKHAKEEPVDLFNASDTMLNAVDEVFEKIEKKRPYNFRCTGSRRGIVLYPSIHPAYRVLRAQKSRPNLLSSTASCSTMSQQS
jgi:hypothetical protein